MSPKVKSLTEMNESAGEAAGLLKALANQDRLLILCYLSEGEKNVSELQELLGIRQPTLSQQLSRLRFEQLVDCRRTGKTIYYRLASDAAGKVIEVLYELYCAPKKARQAASRTKGRTKKAKGNSQIRALSA